MRVCPPRNFLKLSITVLAKFEIGSNFSHIFILVAHMNGDKYNENSNACCVHYCKNTTTN